MNAFEMRVKTGLVKAKSVKVITMSEVESKCIELLKSYPTYRKASLETGIQITRVFRVISLNKTLKIKEIEQVLGSNNLKLCIKEG